MTPQTKSNPWTGAPGSPWRTWAEKDGAKPHECSSLIHTGKQLPGRRAPMRNLLKAVETFHFRPRYAKANLGHPSSSFTAFTASRASGPVGFVGALLLS